MSESSAPGNQTPSLAAHAAVALDRDVAPLVFSRNAMRCVDREATELLGIPGLLLMERAALGLAREILAIMAELALIERVLCVCGPGGNGGDGWAAARHLHCAGANVTAIEAQPPAPGSDAATNRAMARSLGVNEMTLSHWRSDLLGGGRSGGRGGADLIVDAVLGTGTSRPAEGAIRDAIDAIVAARRRGCRVVAADLPSGLDADTGRAHGIAVEAELTVTFAGIKQGLLEACAQRHVGRLVVVPIGVPRNLLMRHGRSGR